MEITEEIRQDESLPEEKQRDIFYTLLNGKTVTEKIETSRGEFVVKFPKQKDIMQVERRAALLRGGIPAESFDKNANFAFQKIAFLDVVVESGPDWFNRAKKRSENFTWGDMPDINFIDEVYVKAWTFRNEVQEKFGRNEKEADGGNSDRKDVQNDVGDDLFSGVAGSNTRT